jgi:hypothetical protein
VLVLESVLPDDAPIEPLLEEPDDVLGDEDEELVSLEPVLLPVVLEDGELDEPLDEPVPEAPIDELLLGELELDEAPVDGEAPIVDEDDDLSVAVLEGVLLLLELGVLELLPVLGVLLLVPVLLPLVEAEPVLLPAEVPALPVPEVWAMASPPKARAAAAARVVRVVLVALILNSLMELPARERLGPRPAFPAGWTED